MKSHSGQNLAGILARIDERLQTLGLSESAASKLAGKSAEAIRNLRRAVESGKDDAGVSSATLLALAPVLKCTAGWLIDGSGGMTDAHASGLSDAQALVVETVIRAFLGAASEDPVLRERLTDTAYQGALAIIIAQYARSRRVHELVARGEMDKLQTAIELQLEHLTDTEPFQ